MINAKIATVGGQRERPRFLYILLYYISSMITKNE